MQCFLQTSHRLQDLFRSAASLAICALWNCVSAEKEGKYWMFVSAASSLFQPLLLSLLRAQSHTVSPEISNRAASEWAETPPTNCSVVMAQLWEWGWQWVNVHTGNSPQYLAWRLGLLFIWVKWMADWPSCRLLPCPDALALLLLPFLLLRAR